jgi:hypothetical protein
MQLAGEVHRPLRVIIEGQHAALSADMDGPARSFLLPPTMRAIQAEDKSSASWCISLHCMDERVVPDRA